VIINFSSDKSPAFYANLYKKDGLQGGHVIMLGPGNEKAALEALHAYPGGLQIGGGITTENAEYWLENQADKVIVTSYIFPDGKLIFIVRDGRDAAVSHRFQAFIDATQHLTKADWAIRTAFERDPEPFLRGERSIFTEKAIRRAAEDWACNVTETDQLGRDLLGEQYIALRYEDLLASPWEQMTRL
jgi:hypothetical protein